MKTKLLLASAMLALSAAATASPAAAWDQIGVRDVKDRPEADLVVVEGHKHYSRIKLCVYRHPVKFYDLDVNFHNGGHQDVQIRSRINAGGCTRNIDLEGGNRDINTIKIVYEETSALRRHATVRIFAE
ncbi:MAG: hypothetical protein K8S25_16480 [Alphaproteobacteria bacterium]|nr:hypothetical protein [Alphaproteobacteria bacterium]